MHEHENSVEGKATHALFHLVFMEVCGKFVD